MTVDKMIRVDIPEEWLQGLAWDQEALIREVVRLGVHQIKVRRALEMYQSGLGSLGYVAEREGLAKRDLIREARARGMEPLYDEQTVREELGTQA
jgi:hypothetical protein